MWLLVAILRLRGRAREKAPGAEIVSGIVTGDTPVSYWPIFSLPLEREVPEVFAKVNSVQFPSRFLSGTLHYGTVLGGIQTQFPVTLRNSQ